MIFFSGVRVQLSIVGLPTKAMILPLMPSNTFMAKLWHGSGGVHPSGGSWARSACGLICANMSLVLIVQGLHLAHYERIQVSILHTPL